MIGLWESIAKDSVDDAVERSKSFFPINSMFSSGYGLTFALGPKLLEQSHDDDVADATSGY